MHSHSFENVDMKPYQVCQEYLWKVVEGRGGQVVEVRSWRVRVRSGKGQVRPHLRSWSRAVDGPGLQTDRADTLKN